MGSFTPVRAVERAFLVLALLNRQPITRVQDLEQDTGLPAATLVRILETLCGLGYVQHHGRRTGYTVTEKARELSAGYHGLPRFIDAAKPVLEKLTETLLWPAALATLEETAMVVRLSTIAQSPVAHTHSTLQKRLDLLSRAHGRAYLAFCPAPERQRLLRDLCASELSRLSPDQLALQMQPIFAGIRHLGYAERDHEIDPETTTVAMPVMCGPEVAATVGITFFRRANPDRKQLIAGLIEAASALEKLADNKRR